MVDRRGLWGIGCGWCIGTMLLAGCSKGTDPALTSLGNSPWSLPGDSGEAEPTGTTASDDNGGGTTSTPGDETAAATSTGPAPGTTSGAMDGPGTFGGDMGEQPVSGWWEHCLPDTAVCDPGLVCLTTDAGTDGVCTSECVPTGDPASCGASPGGTNMAVCLSVGGDSVCALGCEGGLTCPGGMICHTDSDDNGPIAICI